MDPIHTYVERAY
jgi:hypothetical protein